ncbi:MAG: DUF177 domain-containing protein [Candidatus Omnitrophota bacterium]
MKFNINEIPQDGLELTEDFDAKAWDIETQTVKLKAPVHAEAWVTRSKDTAYVSVNVQGLMIEECVRCLNSFEAPLSLKLDFVYPVGERDEILLDEDIRQELMLNYPLKPLCKEACKGLCPVCGKNLNETKCEHSGR